MFNLFFITMIIIIASCWAISFYKMEQKFKNDKLNFEINKLNILFLPIIKEMPYITIRILEKSYKNKYIKFGVTITGEGVADAIMGNSPLDLLKKRVNAYNELESKFNSKPYNIELVLIEN